MITQQAKNQFCELPIKLPLFLTLPSSSPRSNYPKSFASPSLVGLGIVAAMNNPPSESSNTITSVSVPVRSNPIPITGPVTRSGSPHEEDTMEMSESYTCVISHVGNGSVRKRVYYVDGESTAVADMNMDMNHMMVCDDHHHKLGLFYQSSPATPVVTTGFDFLQFCYHCRKSLDGIDIFMYRGDKAFCSPDCRYQQIVADEYREKFRSKSRKRFDCSVSPCSAPLHYPAGVAAA